MDNDFFNQRIQKFGGQFCWIDALFHQGNPFFCVCGVLAFSGDSGLKLFNLCVQFSLFALYFPDSIEKLYSVIRPAAQSSYIRANRVSTSAFRFSALFNSAACFFLAAACPLSLAFNSPLQKPFFIMLYQSRPVLQTGEDIGIKHIITDIVHGALACALPVLATMIMAVRLAVLPVLPIGQRPAAIRTFYQSGKNLRCTILHFLRRFAICSCTCRKTCSLIIGSCVFSTRHHSLWGLRTLRLFLKEIFVSR